ncbi:MAG TPA: hypothetical protein VFZ37_06915 [Jiangellaceae bacterium]
MRTYLTRLTVTAAGAVLTGVSLAGVAHAGEDDDFFVADPAILTELGNLEPCDEIPASDDMLFPVDPNWEPEDLLVPTEPDDKIETPWDGLDLVPCYQIPTDPGDDDGGDDDGGADDGDDGGDDGNGGDAGNGDGGNGGNGGNGSGGGAGAQDDGGTSGQPTDQPSGDPNDGVGDEDFGEAADDASPQPERVALTPTATTGDDTAMLLAVLAGMLGTVGLLILIYGLRKRPRRGQQPAR